MGKYHQTLNSVQTLLFDWFALSSSAKSRFHRLKRELLEVYNIILKFHEV